MAPAEVVDTDIAVVLEHWDSVAADLVVERAAARAPALPPRPGLATDEHSGDEEQRVGVS